MPVITLSSDIGQQDYLIGAVKGQLLSAINHHSLVMVDISHYLSSSNYPKAAYLCRNAFKHFPENSFHIVLLNLFENASSKFLIAQWNKQFIACPDNGILTMIIGEKPKDVFELNIQHKPNLLQITAFLASSIHQIFDGVDMQEIGTKTNTVVEKYPLRATVGLNWMEGQILFIDHFENVIINITKEEFEEHRKGRSFKIVFKRDEVINTIYDNYSSAQEGEKLAFFNSAGYLEIAINKGNMAGLFGLQGFNEKMNKQNPAMQHKWFYQTVRIFFE